MPAVKIAFNDMSDPKWESLGNFISEHRALKYYLRAAASCQSAVYIQMQEN